MAATASIKNLVDGYYRWLREKTEISEGQDGWTAISTPFLGAFNDAIEIYARRENGKITLSDDGETLHNLELQGVSFTHKTRKEHLDTVLRNYGVRLDNGELCVDAKAKDFPQKKHNLLAAIGEVSDMYVLSRPLASHFFRDDVEKFLLQKDLIYTSQFITRGATGIEFVFDFQRTGHKEELLIKVFNSVNRLTASTFLFGWQDIRDAREKSSRIAAKKIGALAIINDESRKPSEEYIDAFAEKGAGCLFWSKRTDPDSPPKLAVA